MRKTSPLNYIYAIGRVRALENLLLKGGVFEEAIDLSLSEALKAFAESDIYSDKLMYVKDSTELEFILSEETKHLEDFIRSSLLDKELLNLIDLKSLAGVERVLKNYQSEFLSDYLKGVIDMHNIKTFLRLYLLKEAGEKLEQALTLEGFLRKKELLLLYSQDITAFLNKLEYVPKRSLRLDYAYFLREAIERIIKEKSFISLEKAIQDFLIESLRPAKYMHFGPEPILAYYLARLNEINLIRMIILAKFNDVSREVIRERLNAVYA